MDKLGIPTLNSGAVDLRLSGDQTQRGTYVQRRRAQMAGGGITQIGKPGGLVEPGIMKYGAWDWIKEKAGAVKDKFVDDIIPNELKNPAVLATLAGVGLNQFGLPVGIESLGLQKGAGKNWMGNILGQDLVFGPGGEQRPETWLPTGAMGDAKDFIIGDGIFGGMDYDDAKTAALRGLKNVGSNVLGRQDMEFGPGWEKEYLGNLAKQQTEKTGLAKIWDQIKGGASSLLGDTTRDGQPAFNWKIPVAGGLAAGAYTASQPRDTLPIDETGINFQTAEQAMADPTQRFKPKEQYVDLAADGGRIGYRGGREVIEKSILTGPDTAIPPDIKKILDVIGGGAGIATLGLPKWLMSKLMTGGVRSNLAQKYMQLAKENRFRDARQLLTAQDPYIGEDPEMSEAKRTFRKYSRRVPTEEEEEFRLSPEMIEEGWRYPGRRSRGVPHEREPAQEGGLMDLGGMEKDYRQEGGFVPIGGQEKADDVPARLSKNEFVFTADAVRAAGGGDIDEGAAVMERVMENLEAGGKVAEESQ